MTLESYLEKVKSLWGQRGKKSWMADWEKIAVNLWREEIKLQGFYFCLTQFLCVVSAPKLQSEEEHVELAELVQCSVKWAFQEQQEGSCALKCGLPSLSCWQIPPAALCPRQSWAGFALFWCALPSMAPSATTLCPGWLCSPVFTSWHSSCPAALPQQGCGNSQANHSENQLNLETKKITLVWNRSFPHALPQCLSSWLSWPLVKCVKEPNPALEHWPFLYETSNFIPRVRAVSL